MGKIITVELRPIDKENWETCANLKVSEDQQDALPNNLLSIAELNFYPRTKAVAILNEEGLVIGFATFGNPEGEIIPKIFRLMIDKNYQGKGYGKLALIQIVKELFAQNQSNEVQVCYHPARNELKKFYRSIGFKEKEIISCKNREEGKMLAVLSRNDFFQIQPKDDLANAR